MRWGWSAPEVLPFCSPCSEMHRGTQGSDSSSQTNTCNQRRRGSSAPKETDLQPRCPSDASVHGGTDLALSREMKALGHCHLPCRDPVGAGRCVDQKDTHIPASTTPTYLNTSTHTLHWYHPLISTKRSMGMVYAPPSISVCPRIHSNCFQMHRLPLLVPLPLEFVVFLPISHCLPSKRSYSRGEKELPHLPCASCSLLWQLTPIHRLQTFKM